MKEKLHILRIVIAFIVLLFSTIGAAQGTTCATAETLTINGACDAASIVDGTQNTPNATGCSFETFRREGWYTFTVPAGPNLNITITASASNRNLFLQLISSTASCTGLSQINCANADTNNGTQTETITTNLATGIYYIKVINNENNNDMNLTSICVTSSSPPTNNLCSTATTLPCGTTNLAGTTNGTTNIVNGTGCGMSNYGVWYTFVGDGQQTTITTNPSFDIKLSVSTGSCGTLTNIVCTDTSPETATFTTVTGTTYYVYVAYWTTSGTTTGNFTISRSCAPAPVPPVNNLCANATALPCGTTNLAGTTVATANIPNTSGCTMSNYGVWYTFTGDGNPTTIATNPSFDIKLSVSTGSCGALTNIVCTDASPETATFTTIVGTTYYVYVGYWSSGGSITGNFTISRSCVTCAPPVANAATNITLTSATVNWSPSSYIPSNGYEYIVSTSATPPASGTSTTLTSINLTGLIANTLYYLHVRSNCGAVNGFSTWSTSSFVAGYCASTATSSSYFINNFSTTGGNVNITNNASGNSAGGYGNFTAQVVSQVASGSIGFTAAFTGGTAGFSIWVDWNDDLDFSDADENVFVSTAYASTFNGNFSIPALATLGNHRMRIVTNGFNISPPACGNSTSSETEDYTITVLPPLPCAGNPTSIMVFLVSTTSTTVSWTAGTPAPSSGYQYYYNTTNVLPNNATVPTGSIAAGITTVTLTGLTIGTKYYFWVRANCTASSTGTGVWVGTTTFTQPSCAVGPGTGTTTLGCPSTVSGGLGLSGAPAPAINCASSGCADLEATFTPIKQTTSYTVSTISYAPPYQYTCMRNPVSVNIDDRWSPVIDLPFNFCFYGNTYNKCLIGSNGILTFDTVTNTAGGTCGWDFGGTEASNIPVSGHDALVQNSIFGVFQDINPGNGGEVGWELITLNTGCRALVASWSNVPMFSNDTANNYTGMMVLYENTNIIEVYVQKKRVTTHTDFDGAIWNDGNAIIGIQNAAGNLATVAPGRNGLDPNWNVTNEAWRFTPSGADVPTTIKWFEGAGVTGLVVGTNATVNVCPATTTTYTAELTYTLCNGLTYSNTAQTLVSVTTNKTWNGSTNTDWNVSSNWTPNILPTVTESVSIPNVANKPIIGSGVNALACSVNVAAGSSLTINSNNNITVANGVTVATGGVVNIKNNASLVQVNNVANSGNINLERIASLKLDDFCYWSSPVGNGSVGTFPVTTISPSTPNNFIYKWGTTDPNSNGGQGNWLNTTENMLPGKGYIVRAPAGLGYMSATPLPFTANFIGTANNGNLTIPIYRGTDFTGPGTQGIIRSVTDDNWNLIGNPYPSAIGVKEFLSLAANSNIVGGIRIWTHTNQPISTVDPFYQNFVSNYFTSDYNTINLSGSVSGPGDYKIGSGQGFMVLMQAGAAGSSTLTFNNQMRNAAFANNQFFRTENTVNTIEQHRLWLDLTNETGGSNRTLLGYITGATANEDRLYDMFTSNKSSQNFYSLINQSPMLIQGKGLPFDLNDTVPMGIKIPTSGNYTIAIATADGIFQNRNQTVYLEDKLLNLVHNLTLTPYFFSTNSGIVNDRFVIKYTENTLATKNENFDNLVSIFVNEGINIKSTIQNIKEVVVYDVLGKVLCTKKETNTNHLILSNVIPTSSMLFVKTTLDDNKIIIKKIIF